MQLLNSSKLKSVSLTSMSHPEELGGLDGFCLFSKCVLRSLYGAAEMHIRLTPATAKIKNVQRTP